jgi:cobalt-zinc-cadmium efflux system outer membrane protein
MRWFFWGSNSHIKICLLIALSFYGHSIYSQSLNLNDLGLKGLYEMAWNRLPESKSYQYRMDAALAKQRTANSFIASPPSLQVSQKTDRLNSNLGDSEFVAGLGIPLWLWNERSSSQGLADAESKKLTSQYYLTRLKLAASVRESYWDFHKARVELELANSRYENAKVLAVDVEKRFRVGDLSRADAHQATGALAGAEAQLAESRANLINAEQKIKTLLGVGFHFSTASFSDVSKTLESTPNLPSNLSIMQFDSPVVQAFMDQLEVARQAVNLAKSQSRASPQLQIRTSRSRDQLASPYQQSVTVGVVVPFGSSSRYENRLATATAEMVEAETRLVFERERMLSHIESASSLVMTSQLKLDAAKRRSTLATETRQFFDKAFRFGEADLPTRLRVELEATEANRQAALAQINFGIAVSNLRQALGLLPE